MKRANNKGFFLAETIVIIALVTTIMAFVYPNVSKLYENYKNRVKYYDQPEDLYVLRAIYDANKVTIDDKTKGGDCDDIGGKNLDPDSNLIPSNTENKINTTVSGFQAATNMNLSELYMIGYISNATSSDYNFNRYLKRMKKTTNDTPSYRLIGVFKDDTNNDGEPDETRYASIKIENPNPNRGCNLGG